jgi:lysozyme
MNIDQLLTPRVVAEILHHEGIVPEAYRDSVGVWTWSVGVTNASGHQVHPRYLDNPQPLARCIEIYIWLLRTKYAPAVLRAFAGHNLTEAQFAAALSFHYNTGAIERADWVKLWKAGNVAAAKKSIMNWRKPAAIIPRRTAECDLFFAGRWLGDATALVWSVTKPRYVPVKPRRLPIMAAIEEALK